MALLASRSFNVVPGRTYINLASAGIAVSSVLCVKRSGLQHDEVANADIDNGVTRQYALDPIRRRLKFPAAVPFEAGETVFVITKSRL